MITTSQNKQIKQVVKLLKSSRERKKTGLFVIEGLRMFREIPEDRREKVFVSSDFYRSMERYSGMFLSRRSLPKCSVRSLIQRHPRGFFPW